MDTAGCRQWTCKKFYTFVKGASVETMQHRTEGTRTLSLSGREMSSRCASLAFATLRSLDPMSGV